MARTRVSHAFSWIALAVVVAVGAWLGWRQYGRLAARADRGVAAR
jgi:predicted negative regulator of RcsB-dependent stress response